MYDNIRIVEICDRHEHDGAQFPYWRVLSTHPEAAAELSEMAEAKGLLARVHKLDSLETAIKWIEQL